MRNSNGVDYDNLYTSSLTSRTRFSEAEVINPNITMETTSRADFLTLIKDRAIEELLYSRKPENALASFMSDVMKFKGNEPVYSPQQLHLLMMTAQFSCVSILSMKHWIEGCC